MQDMDLNLIKCTLTLIMLAEFVGFIGDATPELVYSFVQFLFGSANVLQAMGTLYHEHNIVLFVVDMTLL